MEEIMKHFFSLIAIACMTAGCADSVTDLRDSDVTPSFAAVAQTSNLIVPIAITVGIPCAGEIVQLTGTLHLQNHLTLDDAGGAHFKTHAQPQGISGDGLISGDKYQGTGVTQEHDNFNAGGLPIALTFVNNFRIIGQGSGNNLLIHTTAHLTVNENGVVTANVSNASAECR
jgi:hypothetical protein